jgi:hypothetical protein
MKKWKWIALVLSGGVLLQTSTCSDFGYYLMQALATQVVTLILNAATGTTATV